MWGFKFTNVQPKVLCHLETLYAELFALINRSAAGLLQVHATRLDCEISPPVDLPLKNLPSMDSSRGKRAKPVNKAKSALEELAELRRTGGKRVATYEVEEETAVYDVMDDDEYSKFAAQRRDEAGRCFGCSGARVLLLLSSPAASRQI